MTKNTPDAPTVFPARKHREHIEKIECFRVSTSTGNTNLQPLDFKACFRVSSVSPYRGRLWRTNARPHTLLPGGVA